jgi:hypothetical protein
MVIFRPLVLAALAGSAFTVPVQAQNSARCRVAATSREFPASRLVAGEECRQLAGIVVDSITNKFWVSPRDVEPSVPGSAAPAGSPAQGEAVPTIQPVALAATSLATVGTDAGSDAIAAITINPSTLFGRQGDPRAVAQAARFTDVTVFLPISGIDQNKDGRPDYLGVRVRLNLSAASQASALMKGFEAAVGRVMLDENARVIALTKTFEEAPDPQACAAALTSETGDTRDACGVDVAMELEPRAYAEMRRLGARIREEADARYVGLDLRVDVGDPTLGAVPKAAGTALVAGLGFGRRFGAGGEGPSGGIKGRLGVRYVSLRDTSATDWQADGGLGFELMRPLGQQRIQMSAGVEFRFGRDRGADSLFQTRYLMVRGALSVPVSTIADLTVSFGTPLMGDVSPTLAVAFDWRLLLDALSRGPN